MYKIYQKITESNNTTVEQYVNQAFFSKGFKPITNELFNEILEEGFAEEVSSETEPNIKDFLYDTLNLSDEDSKGLREFNDATINKFNSFDILLKDKQEGYPKIVDFIDYDLGKVYIIKYIA
jgi:hypothetical protein